MKQLISLILATTIALSGFVTHAAPWPPGTIDVEYNEGPDPATAWGREIIDIYAELPEYMEMSKQLMEAQKFRYTFGLMMTRMFGFSRNSVKIFFIGQDATHVAEASKQPGTSGFGGRVQAIGNIFGVDQGVATTNEFLSTIKGQYGTAGHPYIEFDKDGNPQLKDGKYVDNELWLLANGKESQVRIQRERFWMGVLKNNPDSLKLIATFGGAAADGFAEFLISCGAKVGTRMDPKRLKSIQVPESKIVSAGSNAEFAVPIDKQGRDIYRILLAKQLGGTEKQAFKDLLKKGALDYTREDVREAALEAMKRAGREGIDMMVFTGGGLEGSGMINAAQLGGYDLSKVWINGEHTNSLKGLRLPDGTVIKDDIGFTTSPHPTALSMMTEKKAVEALTKAFSVLEPLKKVGWRIEPDLNDDGKPRRNLWDEGKPLTFGRADIRPGFFEDSSADDRRATYSSATRLDAQVIIINGKDKKIFDKNLVEQAKAQEPSDAKDPRDLWSNRPRQKDTRYVFDRGPGRKLYAALMRGIDRKMLFAPKPGMQTSDHRGTDTTFDTHGIDAYNTKTYPGAGVFGAYRGTFTNPRAFILADPQGLTDWITSRAMTGERGQYLNGLMRDLGFEADQLVIKTAPVGMDGATDEEWAVVLKATEKFREVAFQEAIRTGKIEVIFTDGEVAKAEMARLMKKFNIEYIPVVNISRTETDMASGIKEAGEQAKSYLNKDKAVIQVKRADILRSQLPWWARTWEGTSGDTVIDAKGKERGRARALITPNWVAQQKVLPSQLVLDSIKRLADLAEKAGLRMAGEDLATFLKRRGLGNGQIILKQLKKSIEACEKAATSKAG